MDWFLVGMVGATVLAWLFPRPGASGGWLHPELLTKAGVALIFFLHGLGLAFGALKAGVLQWRVHLLVQATTFVLFPVLGLLLVWSLGLHGELLPDLRLGLFYLCALPSTVSSSVAMTAVARGNVAVALFNATLSSVLGIWLTPFWVAWFMSSGEAALTLGPVILDLVRWLLLPLIAGQVMRRWWGVWVMRNRRVVNTVDRGTILLLVYTSFCDSFVEGVWTAHGWGTVLLVVVCSLGLFGVVMAATWGAAVATGLGRADRIAVMFCGSKKTMASGVPMARLLFGAHPGLGVILLPILVYHPLQLLICGVLAERWRQEVADEAAPQAN